MNIEISIKKFLGDFILDIDFKVTSGFIAFFGPSGSGKTSAINIIAGVMKPDKAKIILDDRVLVDTSQNKFLSMKQREIGYVFQDSRLFPHYNVKNNLKFGAWFSESNDIQIKFKDVIQLLKIEHLLHRSTLSLSGGEKQRVAIGRAILKNPKIILMDEPLASLDREHKADIMPYINKLYKEYRIPIIYVTHSVEEVLKLTKEVIIFDNGRVKKICNILEFIDFLNVRSNKEKLKKNYLAGTIKKIDKINSVSQIEVNKNIFYTTSILNKINENIILVIYAKDIILSINKPDGISSLNVIKVIIKAIIIKKTFVEITLLFNNEIILAHISKISLNNLKLYKKMSCYAILKAVSIEQNNGVIKLLR